VNRYIHTAVRGFLAAILAYGFFVRAADAAPFSNLVVFGDSLSDLGNISQATFGSNPGRYYWNGRFSNGPVYAESLATGLGLPALARSSGGGNDFAYGGAKTTGTSFPNSLVIQDVDDQVGLYLNSRTVDPQALYVVFAGANDLLGGQTNVSVPVNSLSQSINRLISAGARQFLVFNLPPLGYTPRYNANSSTLSQYNNLTQQFNASLATMLNGLAAGNPALSVYRFDVAALFSQAIANPSSFGLTNVTTPAAPGLQSGASSYDTSRIAANANQYLFWDDLHPTTAVHAILGQRATQLFFAPGDFNHDSKVDMSDYVVWRKGLGNGFLPADYDVWRAHFGQMSGASASDFAGALPPMSIPEPAAILLALIASYYVAWRRRSF